MRARLALAGSLVLATFTLGCNKEPAPAPEQPLNDGTAAAARAAAAVSEAETRPVGLAAPAQAEASAARARISEAPFELSLTAKGEFEASKPGMAEVTLDAKEPFKINEQYPYKLKLQESPGIKFAALVVGKDRAQMGKKQLTMPVTFTPDKPGKYKLSGQFSFSICTDDKCLIEKRDLALDVDVK